MIWSDFVLAVNEHLSVDASRRGTEALRARAMKNAVIDLQRMIDAYRVGHTTLYAETDLAVFGKAHLGTLPVFARPSAFYIYSSLAAATSGDPSQADFSADDFSAADFATGGSVVGDFSPTDFSSTDFSTTGGAVVTTPANPLTNRNRLDFHKWIDRQSMIDGTAGCRAYRYSISPAARKFLIYPQLSAGQETYLLLVWSGIKETFAGTDIVPWPEAAAEAVGLYVNAQLERKVNKSIPMAREMEADYVVKRRALYREAKDALDAEKDDEENIDPSDVVAPPAP